MRLAISALILLTSASAPAVAGNMRQSPMLGHKAGEACAPGHPKTLRAPGYRMSGCISGKR